jgi:hypothetical protein
VVNKSSRAEDRHERDVRCIAYHGNTDEPFYRRETASIDQAGSYSEGGSSAVATASNGRADFDRRVDAAVSARRLTRTQGTRLKADYAAAVQIEAGFLRRGVISANEQADLDARLDALDARVGDTNVATPAATPKSRLDAIITALPSSGLGSTAQTQLRVEHQDLSRSEAAYGRLNPSSEERAYLERRLTDLESQARVRR